MEYNLTLLTNNTQLHNTSILFTTKDVEQFTIKLMLLSDHNGINIYDHRRSGYQLVLQSPIELEFNDIEKVQNEVLKQFPNDVIQYTPKLIDVATKVIINNKSIIDLYNNFNSNVLCSAYSDNVNVIETVSRMKRLNMNEDEVVQIDPMQTVFRLSDIRKRNIFPNINFIIKGNSVHVLENVLTHMSFEKTVYSIGYDSYVSLSPHVGFIETKQGLIVWFVSQHIIVSDMDNRVNAFDPVIKHNTNINTNLLIKNFQDVLDDFNFVSISIIENRSIYSFEDDVLIFIGDFPGDAVTSTIKDKYQKCISLYK